MSHASPELPSSQPDKFWEPLPDDDPRLPFQTTKVIDAIVPEASKKYLNHTVEAIIRPNGASGYHHRLILPEGVMVAHVDEDGALAMVDNYRHPIRRWSRELPSGAVNEGEDLAEAASRETREETGYNLPTSRLTRLFPGPLQGSVGFARQTFHIYHGEGGVQGDAEIDDEEQGAVTAHRIPLADAVEQIGAEVVDPASSAAIGRLALMYGIKPSFLSDLSLPKSLKH